MAHDPEKYAAAKAEWQTHQRRMTHPAVWRHKKTGNLYYVLSLNINESDYVVQVQYEPINATDADPPWLRPLDSFLDRFEPYQPSEPTS